MKRKKTGLLYITPWLIGFLILTIWPIISSFYYALTDYSLARVGQTPEFLGLQNYINLFRDQTFIESLKATLIYTVFTVPFQLGFALFVAFILNFKLKGINFYRTAYYIPSILGGNIAIGVLWRSMFQPKGLVNIFLGTFGVQPIDWLSTPTGAMTVLIILKIWQFGSSMLIFLAALKEIPQDLYESAGLDGASKFTQFYKITMPLITPTIFFNLVMQLNNAFQEFNGPFIVTGRGPLNSTYLTSMFIYDKAFKEFDMGYASAASWVLFALIVCSTIIVFASQKKWVYYSDGGGK
ncbi:sugar ABC transporter permease [Enterococcus sp. BWB1-3]|uniref:carbohydrate ABC transporter permease n=1 Tax=unclassified Enterococcus TaxID=2608891 RepID=UPI0019214222|nr:MULTISPECIES: sugar ABC transporter permease [unclassified Enterococcus]MBL1230504.1 sugar ABC transporter permease [Enterococcus sp. BWB1-3]MCB5954219.1 sugar ABC transporter permease [Enterococcus sp. CWB-B31]